MDIHRNKIKIRMEKSNFGWRNINQISGGEIKFREDDE